MAMTRTSGIAFCAIVLLSILLSSEGSESCAKESLDYRWETAIQIENTTGNAWYPEIAVDDSGNAMVTWAQSDGDHYNIWSNRYVVGDGWGTAAMIETNDSGDAYWPEITMDGSGNAIVVWTLDDGICQNVWSNRYVVGAGWETAIMIETNDSGDAIYPKIAADASGNAIAVWSQYDAVYHADIWWNRYVVGTGWGVASKLERNDTLVRASGPQIAMGGSGNAIAVWYEEDTITPYQNIWSSRYVVGAGWEDAFAIQTSDSEEAYIPTDIAVDDAGSAVAVWIQDDGVRKNVWANRYTVGTGWEAPSLLETDDSGDAWVPKLAIDGSGNTMVIWHQSDGVYDSVWTNRYVVGAGWEMAEVIESYDSGDAYGPQIAVDAAGNAIAVWMQDDGPRSDIWANRYVLGTGWGSPVKIETDDAGDAIAPEIAWDPLGNATVVWHQEDMYRANIWSNRYVQYDAVPPPIEISSPSDGSTTETQAVTVAGSTEPGADLTINGASALVASNGSFSLVITLVEGANVINVTATDESGNSATVMLSVTYVDPVSRLEAELDDVKFQNLVLTGVVIALVALIAIMSVVVYTLRRRIAGLKTEPLADEQSPPTQEE